MPQRTTRLPRGQSKAARDSVSATQTKQRRRPNSTNPFGDYNPKMHIPEEQYLTAPVTGKYGKYKMEDWTDQEVYTGIRRTYDKKEVARIARLMAQRANEGGNPVHYGPPRSKDEMARLQNRYRAEADSFNTVYYEDSRRQGRRRLEGEF